MASTFGMLWLLLAIKCCICFHCGWDVDLDQGSTDVTFLIDTRPKLNADTTYWITEGEHVGTGNNYAAIQPRFSDHNYYTYWPSNMEFYLFGTISAASAVITMGFYDTDDSLVYGVVIDCGAGTWQTEYNNASYTTNQVWKSGKLLNKCEPGSTFDIDYEVQQRHRGKFLFNGQPLEIALYPKYMKDPRFHRNYWTGYHRIEKLPVDLTDGTTVKATVNDGTLTRYAYGKCYAFPRELRRNCTEASEWIMARNKVSNPNVQRKDEPRYMVDKPELGLIEEFGLNTIYANVDCFETGSKYFHMVQMGIHSDQNSDSYPYCCCASMNGTLADDTCNVYKESCDMECLDYSYYRVLYEGLEEFYSGAGKYSEMTNPVEEI